MNIIYPKSEQVDQFLVDIRDAYHSLNPKKFEDLADKVVYFPKSILSNDGKILSAEEVRQQFKHVGVKKIVGYLKDIKLKLAKFEFFYKVHQDFSHIDKFLQAFKQYRHCNNKFIEVDDSKIVSADFYCDRSYSQDIRVEVNKTPDVLALDQQILEIVDKKLGPVKILELSL